MDYFKENPVLWNVLLRLDEDTIRHLCSQLEGNCSDILTDNNFWREKLSTQGVNFTQIHSPIPDYKRIYDIIENLTKDQIYSVFNQAALKNDLSLIRVLIESNYFSSSTDFCEALDLATRNNYKEIVIYLLQHTTACRELKPNPILSAARNGNLEILSILLNDERTNLSTSNNLVIDSFLHFNVRLPKKGPFPDPRTSRPNALSKNFEDVAILLIRHPTVNLKSQNLLYRTILTGNGYILLSLLKLYKERKTLINLAFSDNLLIRLAADDGLIDVVDLLSYDSYYRRQIDPAAKNNEALNRAAYRGYTEVVEILLKDSAVKNGGTNRAYQYAKLNANFTVMEILS